MKLIVMITIQAEIDATVPKTTYSPREATSSTSRTQTQREASVLSSLVRDLEDIRHSRQQIIDRARRQATRDDIKPAILRQAEILRRKRESEGKGGSWTDVDPKEFDEVIEGALAKYDGFQVELEEGGEKQKELLDKVKVSILLSSLHDGTVFCYYLMISHNQELVSLWSIGSEHKVLGD